MATEALQFFTPVVGRFVSGSLTEKRSKDNDGRPIAAEDQRYEFGVAFEKAEIWQALFVDKWWPYLNTALAADHNGLTRMQQWFSNPAAKGVFSMKVSDGDLPNSKNVVNENTRGKYVIWFSAIDVTTVGPNNEDLDRERIKRGDYVQVAGNMRPNGLSEERAGVYMNANIVRLVGEGDPILGGMDPNEAFGGSAAPTALPPGARPVGSGSGAAGAFGGAPAAPTAAPAPVQTAPVVPGAVPGAPAMPGTASPTDGIQPHTAILSGPPPLPGT